jgi:lipopolysaccharide transport system ATP-binding protein
MEDVGKEGRTVLFVSHNMAHINNLCSDCILLSLGHVSKRGQPSLVIQEYLSQTDRAASKTMNGDALLIDLDIDLLEFFSCDEAGNPKKYFKSSEHVNVRIKYRAKRDIYGLRVGFDLVGFTDGEVLFRTYDDDTKSKPRRKGVEVEICSIPKNLLRPGIYLIRLQVGIHNVRWVFNGTISEKITIELVDGVNNLYADYRPGKIMPQVEWNAKE